MRILRRLMPVAVIAAGIFMATLPQGIYAQPIDINKTPLIMKDKEAIRMDLQMLKYAKKIKDPARIKYAKQMLRQDTLKMKADKVRLKKVLRKK